VELSGPGRDTGIEPIEVALLRDIRTVWDERGWTMRRPSADVCHALVDLEEAQWATCSRGDPLTQHRLASMLKAHGIRPSKMRPGSGGEWVAVDDSPGSTTATKAAKTRPLRGYVRSDFEPVWKRLLDD
jgi:hypothetical protein